MVTVLQHHGIKGQKWGVRRYQNYDGRYTQAGLARYNESVADYNKHKQRYKEMKKEGGYSRHELKVQKGKMKLSKNQANRRYELLKQDKLADKGKIRYQEGERILERNAHTNTINKAAGYSASIGTVMMTKPDVVEKGVEIASTLLSGGKLTVKLDNTAIRGMGAGMVVGGATAATVANGKRLVDERKNREIRAYYSHTYRR